MIERPVSVTGRFIIYCRKLWEIRGQALDKGAAFLYNNLRSRKERDV